MIPQRRFEKDKESALLASFTFLRKHCVPPGRVWLEPRLPSAHPDTVPKTTTRLFLRRSTHPEFNMYRRTSVQIISVNKYKTCM